MEISESDLAHHVVSFGIDVYPPIQIPEERTRLNMFYEEARNRWSNVYEKLVVSDSAFQVSKDFRRKESLHGQAITIDTLVLTPRGPVFVFPLLLPEPIGDTTIEPGMLELFRAVRKLFFDYVPNRKTMRLGMVHEVVFATGKSSCERVLGVVESLANARLITGSCNLLYQDENCNINVKFQPMMEVKQTQLPIGAMFSEPGGFGLGLHLDVNNKDLRPLEDKDVEVILDRASSLWPDTMLEFLRSR